MNRLVAGIALVLGLAALLSLGGCGGFWDAYDIKPGGVSGTY